MSGAMPMPSSRTWMMAFAASALAPSVIVLPLSLYFDALFSRLAMTCAMRAGSALIRSPVGGMSV
jgi:hypothetical protein